MTFAAIDSELTGPLFATAEMRAVFSDRARIAAMLAVETALARAEAAEGLAPKGLAAAIRRITPEDFDIAALGEATAKAGVPSIPFVRALEEKLPEKLAPHVHHGATSQDLIDTALVLQVREGLDLIARDLAAILTGLARLTKKHRQTPCVARTYGQHAAPAAFGYVTGVWLAGIADVAAEFAEVRRRALTASLGGAVGTLAELGDKGAAVAEGFAAELALAPSPTPWHTRRARIVTLGAWLAMLTGALAKMAADVAHLGSTEVGEVAEPHEEGRGGSSAMPHKQNPLGATVILAAHGAAPGLAATLIAAMAAEGQRPAGAWHAEWHALPQLFGLASGALREAKRLAEGLTVDAKRMAANLDMTRGLLFAGAAAAHLAPKLGRSAAHDIVGDAADAVRRTGRPLQAVLADDQRIPKRLAATLAEAFDMAPAVAAAAAAADRALAGAEPVAAALLPPKGRR